MAARIDGIQILLSKSLINWVCPYTVTACVPCNVLIFDFGVVKIVRFYLKDRVLQKYASVFYTIIVVFKNTQDFNLFETDSFYLHVCVV